MPRDPVMRQVDAILRDVYGDFVREEMQARHDLFARSVKG